MLQTYKATLNGNQLEWRDEVPEEMKNSRSVNVIVTILDDENDKRELRPFGLSENEFVVPDNFDAPLPEDVSADFENVRMNFNSAFLD